MITIEDIKDYLGIDYEDLAITIRLKHLKRVADLYLEGALGIDYPQEDERVKEIALIIIEDLYDNHSLNDKVSGNVRRLINDFSLQIKCDMKRKKG
ncbi:phage gp6-like head-tail connector protein [Romboutsia ilealis]|uniref:Phage gp6-like head-tail connector protein n=1 Tax=Romboutsia faecis TaxID=2764597 RepID=A0ABR7JN82_9FIRM|nr:phage gp6-like head-tail connector protein [Romboutsia faecis]MBC5996373.1 phage gp6-like head-tail connector protein [Romboutsia faecis]MRN24991.1 phage gp6-like head-tail connector protein [Romboutsia ilealis]